MRRAKSLIGVNPNSNTPRIIYGDFRNSRDADRFLENGSYFRMKNISIGYNFKQKWLTNLGVEKLRLFATGSNLITITGYSGLDPRLQGCEFRLEQWYGQLCLSQYPFGDVWIGFDLLTYKSVCKL
ncbi:hypothetical protein NIB75_04670 [Bacteroides uniformis]|nr:hypothetical protein [Bacteroides uniformis]